MGFKKMAFLVNTLVFFKPMTLGPMNSPLSEPTYILSLEIALFAVLRILDNQPKNVYPFLILSGVTFGVGWLTKPISILLPVLTVVFIIVSSNNKFHLALNTIFWLEKRNHFDDFRSDIL